MAKLCPRGKAAAKRKFKVYPSAYANMYASAVCSGKVTPGGKKKRKKAADGGSMNSMMRQAQKNYTGSYISGDLGGVKVGNKSYKKYYSNPGFRMPKI